VDLYAASKQAAEDLLLCFHEVNRLSCATLTLFETYGPADPRRKLLSLLLEAAGGNMPLGLSPGEQILDLTHVDDVVDAFCVAAEAMLQAPEPVWEKAFVSGERMTVRDLVGLLKSTLAVPLDVEFGARPYRPREIMAPIAPAPSRVLSGWTPRRRLLTELPALAHDVAERRKHAS
jgi:nucleoside-diphosphate-sugar epimerase